MLAGSRSGAAAVLDPRQPGAQLLELRGHSRAVAAATVADFGSMGPRAATASGDWTVRLWDLRSGACTAVLAGAAGPASGVRLWGGRGHGVLVAAHADGTLRPWRLRPYGGFAPGAVGLGGAGAWERRATQPLHAVGGLPPLAVHDVPGAAAAGAPGRLVAGGGAHWILWDLAPLGVPDGSPTLRLAAAAVLPPSAGPAACSAVFRAPAPAAAAAAAPAHAALLVAAGPRGRLLCWALPAAAAPAPAPAPAPAAAAA